MPDRQAIQVPGLKAIGPYSQAVRAAGLLFVAGQPGVLPLRAASYSYSSPSLKPGETREDDDRRYVSAKLVSTLLNPLLRPEFSDMNGQPWRRFALR